MRATQTYTAKPQTDEGFNCLKPTQERVSQRRDLHGTFHLSLRCNRTIALAPAKRDVISDGIQNCGGVEARMSSVKNAA